MPARCSWCGWPTAPGSCTAAGAERTPRLVPSICSNGERCSGCVSSASAGTTCTASPKARTIHSPGWRTSSSATAAMSSRGSARSRLRCAGCSIRCGSSARVGVSRARRPDGGAARLGRRGRPLTVGSRAAVVGVGRGDSAGLLRALTRLAELARERRAVFLKVDPELETSFAAEPLRASGFVRSAQDIQPVLATLELDLAPDEDALLAALDKDTRWSVKQGPKRGVSVREVSDDTGLRAFY